MAASDEQSFTPPYASWTMFESTVERMRQDGMPARVDRSYLGTASGSARAQLTGALKALGLIDDELRPTDTLKRYVADQEQRPVLMRSLLEQRYAAILALDPNATQQQLEEAFRDAYGIQGSTVRKAISFFLAAAKSAGLKLSPLFSAPRVTATRPAARRKPRTTRTADNGDQPSPPMADPKQRYIDLLLRKAEEEMSDDLLDRIERAIGFQEAAKE